MKGERFTCCVCGKSFDDPRPLRLFGTEEPVSVRCESCLDAGVVEAVTPQGGVERFVFSRIEPIVRDRDPRRKRREASRG